MEIIAVLADQRLSIIVDSPGSEAVPDVPIPRNRQIQRRLPPDEQEALITAYKEGATAKDLAAQFGIHTETVSAILERHGIPRRYKQLTGKRLQEAIELYELGLSLGQVGAKIGVHGTTVHLAFKKNGVARRAPWGR